MARLTDALVEYYKFDENTGNTVGGSLDVYDGAWNGTLGSQWTTGKLNSAGTFNGSDNYVLLRNGAILGGRVNSSVSLWIKGSSSAGITYNFYNERASAGNDLYRLDQEIGSNIFAFTIRDDAGNLATISLAGSTALNDNNWHHLVMAKMGTIVSIYQDNVLLRQSSISSVSNNFTDANIQSSLGAHSAGSTEYYPGIIDEVGLWARALTNHDVKLLYNGGAGLSFPFNTGGIITNNLRPAVFTPGRAR